LEAVQLSNAESSKAFEARLAEVESKAGILQDQFNAAVRTAEEAKQAKQAEMETARLRLQEMKQTVAQLQTRLETAVRAEKETAASAQARLQQDQETINDLKARLDVATRHAKGSEEAATSKISQLEENIRELMARLAAAQDRLQQDQTTNADLQTRLDVATRRLKESEEAATSKIGQLEESHRELMARLAIAEQAEFRVTELTAQLEAARSELRAQLEVSAQSAETPNTVLNSNEPAQVSEKDSGESVMPIIEFYEEPAVESVASPGSTEETVAPTVAEEEAVPVLAKTEIVPSETLAVAETLPVAAPVLEPESPKVPISVETASESAPIPVESPAKTKAPKVTKRKKARRDAQMDLFGGSGERQEPPHPDTANIAEELAAGENDLPKHEPAPPAELPVANESEAPADDTNGKQTLDQPEPQPEQEIENPVPEPKLPAESGLNLPPIEGLAINDGLALADGNAALYLKALLGFVEQQASAPAKIRDALVQGDAAAAARVLQGLKSVAGEIGANTVHHTAVALAQSIQGDGEPGEIEFLWAELEKAVQTLVTDLKSALVPKEEKAAPVRRLPAPPPVNPPQLRKAISQILPLLVDSDPGAKDCLKDNRSTFRSAFTPEGYAEFEQCVKSGDFHQALEHLKKAAKKHNISV
ncbi:MAG TPA: hypothetical protein VEC99_13815, partial [Clostridia bacterium]|nr:hypothetical protein [Clostridia bacterium]